MLLRPYCSLASSNYVIQAKRAEVEAEVAKLEAELEALGNVDTLTTRKDELKVQIRAGQTRLTQLRNDEKQINESLAGVNNTIAELERQIAEEQARLETRSRDKRDRTTAQLQAANAELADKETKHKHAGAEKLRLNAEADAAEAEARRLRQEQNEVRGRIVECDEQIRRCGEMEKSKLARFGNNMEWVLEEIRKAQWYGQPPVGPFGLYVKAKDPERWGNVLRIVIGSLMGSFAITDPRDRNTLAKILAESKK